ncbi:hypothetical protein LLG90_04745 [Aromatoleum toluclasticum]|uniref:hypothetical protein n=1 Tax=Aromatoleum toluclasticum TaxID=92003 RepID=UPI001D189A8D|nr:hypothetical protein [Aromatoleum toluclasticum]MCC4114657.1 hypothetical protein [Aromatoleum toluclasticum]
MADLDSRPVSSVRDFTPARPTFPQHSQVECDKDGYRSFTIPTPKGEVRAEEGWGEWRLRGTAEALEAFGAIDMEWLPGRPGNGNVRQKVVFGTDGRIFLGVWRGRHPRLPYISIAKSDERTFTVEMPFNSAEQAEFHEFRRQREQRQTWETAKAIRQDRDFIGDWQKSILQRISELEGLIDGSRGFTGFPDIGLRLREQKPILSALADARAWVECCTPQLKDAIRKDNVYSLNGETYRGIQSR